MLQADLFARSSLPAGMEYRTNFISECEEQHLLAFIHALPLTEAKYQQFTARRRTVNFGAGYDFAQQRATPAPTIP